MGLRIRLPSGGRHSRASPPRPQGLLLLALLPSRASTPCLPSPRRAPFSIAPSRSPILPLLASTTSLALPSATSLHPLPPPSSLLPLACLCRLLSTHSSIPWPESPPPVVNLNINDNL